MRAMTIHAYGPIEQLRFEERPAHLPGPTEVVLQTHAVGVNFTDGLVLTGQSQMQRSFPFTPGVEAAGVVIAVGDAVTRFRPGDRACGNSLSGGYAEQVAYEEDELFALPDGMDMRDAATFFIASMTAHYAVRTRAKLKRRESLLVLGAGGGVGIAAVQIGKALGAHVVAAASSEDKLELARQAGADALLQYDRGLLDLAAQKALTKDLLRLSVSPKLRRPRVPDMGKINSLTSDAGYHVVVDGVGGVYAEPTLRALAWEGRYTSIGFAAGMANVALGPALFKNADIMGIQPSSPAIRMPGRNPKALAEMLRWYEAGKLRPVISAELPLEEAVTAIRMLRDRKATGRVVLTTDAFRGS